jgi:hypothetical protein
MMATMTGCLIASRSLTSHVELSDGVGHDPVLSTASFSPLRLSSVMTATNYVDSTFVKDGFTIVKGS